MDDTEAVGLTPDQLVAAAMLALQAAIIALQDARKGSGEDGARLRPISIAITEAQTAYLWVASVTTPPSGS